MVGLKIIRNGLLRLFKNNIWTGNLEHQQNDQNFYIYGEWRAKADA